MIGNVHSLVTPSPGIVGDEMNASTKANGRHVEHLDEAASAALLCEAERTRKAPEKATFARLAHEWAEGVMQAEQDGRPGVDRWLRTVQARDPAR